MPKSLITVRLEPELRATLARIAESEDRSVTYLVTKILRDWLIAREQA